MRQLSLFEPAEVLLTKGYTALVDPIDVDLINLKWHAVVKPGMHVYAGRKNHTEGSAYIHRIVLERMIGRSLLSTEAVDHIDGNTLNNCRSNLRLATWAENLRNSKRHSDSTSPYKGITLDKRSGRWCAQIWANKKHVSLGHYSTPEEAHAAYCKGASELFGEFARFE